MANAQDDVKEISALLYAVNYPVDRKPRKVKATVEELIEVWVLDTDRPWLAPKRRIGFLKKQKGLRAVVTVLGNYSYRITSDKLVGATAFFTKEMAEKRRVGLCARTARMSLQLAHNLRLGDSVAKAMEIATLGKAEKIYCDQNMADWLTSR